MTQYAVQRKKSKAYLGAWTLPVHIQSRSLDGSFPELLLSPDCDIFLFSCYFWELYVLFMFYNYSFQCLVLQNWTSVIFPIQWLFPPSSFWRKSPELITLLWSFAAFLQNSLHLSLSAALMSLRICKVSLFVIGWKHECLPFLFNWHFVLVLMANVIAITPQAHDKEN